MKNRRWRRSTHVTVDQRDSGASRRVGNRHPLWSCVEQKPPVAASIGSNAKTRCREVARWGSRTTSRQVYFLHAPFMPSSFDTQRVARPARSCSRRIANDVKTSAGRRASRARHAMPPIGAFARELANRRRTASTRSRVIPCRCICGELHPCASDESFLPVRASRRACVDQRECGNGNPTTSPSSRRSARVVESMIARRRLLASVSGNWSCNCELPADCHNSTPSRRLCGRGPACAGVLLILRDDRRVQDEEHSGRHAKSVHASAPFVRIKPNA
jgi:hypothetical protein